MPGTKRLEGKAGAARRNDTAPVRTGWRRDRRVPVLLAIALAVVFPSVGAAGSISGTVRGVPPVGPAAGAGGGGAYESRRYKYVEKIDYDNLRDFVVYVDAPLGAVVPEGQRTQAVKTTQKDATFDPHVLPVVVGSTVRWPNEDDIFHNVFSMSDAKEFDLGYYKKERVPEVRFDRVGRVDVYCAIHTKMHCIILVLPNPYFALADEKGRFVIRDVPPGTYRVRAWHERLPAQTLELVVPAAGEVKADFTLGVGRASPP